jgi:MFS family permease
MEGETNYPVGGVVVTPDFLDQLNLNNNPSLISTVTAIYDIGCFLGAISVCAIGDPLGRKKCVLLGTTIMSIGAIIQIASFNVPEMIVGRSVPLSCIPYLGGNTSLSVHYLPLDKAVDATVSSVL